jgi:hypothetical protein
MGFEAPRRLTPSEVLAQLDAGEIKPGRILRDVVIPLAVGSITARVNETEQIITYTHNGVSVEASFNEVGPTSIAVTNPVTERSIADQAVIDQHKKIVAAWHKNRQN